MNAKNLIAGTLALALLVVLIVTVARSQARRVNPKVTQFVTETEPLIRGLQEYRKFVGAFPAGSAVDVANALSGQSESAKKVLVLAANLDRRNPKGELIDPWGNALQFFFTAQNVLIRSAGPNGRFEDCSSPASDDLFRSDAR